MVYANDQWIQLPTRDLYDTQIMAMAINAARDMYEKGQQEMKEFQKAYGDFLTPIMADQDWYNQNVTGKVRDAVNALYAQGIDPLRNAQGRAVISQLINNMPYGDIAKKRMRAKNAEEYYKNMAAFRLNDKYNEDFSKWLGEDPNQWAPDSVGVTSPTVFKTLKDATNDWYNNRTPRDLTTEEKKQLGLDPRYNYTGYFDSDLMNVAKGQTPGWQGTPISNYYRELAKRKLQAAGVENPTVEQVEAVLQRDIANAQQEWLVGPVQGNADAFELENLRFKRELALQNLKNQQARSLAAMKNNQTTDQEAPTTFMDRLQTNMNKNFEEKNYGKESVAKTFSGIIDYWDKVAKSYESQGKVTGSEKYTEETRRLEGGFVPGMTMSTASRYGTKTEEKERPTYDQKNNASYNKAMYEKGRWSNFVNGNYYPSRYDTRKTSDGKYIVHIIRDIIKKGDKATPQELAFLRSYQQEDVQRAMMQSKSSSPTWSTIGGQRGAMSVTDAKKRASDFWDSFSAEGLGSLQNKVLHQQFVGATNSVKDPDLPNGYYSVRFGSGYHYAPVRQLSISGGARFKHNDIHNKFDRFLNGETGVSINENDVKGSGIPHTDRMGKSLDILSHPLITKEQMVRFYNSLTDSDKKKFKSVDDVAKHLGLRPVDQKITYKDKDNNLHDTDTYYEVPVIRTIENLGGYNFRDINVLSDIIEFGASTADKNIINSENQSVTDDLPYELAIQMLQ